MEISQWVKQTLALGGREARAITLKMQTDLVVNATRTCPIVVS